MADHDHRLDVQIDSLRLRLPEATTGHDRAADGRRIGRDVADAIAAQAPLGVGRSIGAGSVRVTVDPGATHDQIVDAVARAVLRTLS